MRRQSARKREGKRGRKREGENGIGRRWVASCKEVQGRKTKDEENGRVEQGCENDDGERGIGMWNTKWGMSNVEWAVCGCVECK